MKYYSKDKMIKYVKDCILSGSILPFPPCDFDKEDEGEFQLFVDEWFDIFPKNIKSGNFYIRTDKKDCLKKLGKFMTNYPEYSKEVILEATKRYVKTCANSGYRYMKLAPYFIYKDNMSMLEGYCQQVLLGKEPREDSHTTTIEDNDIEEHMI